MPQRNRQKQALTRLQRRVDWLTRRIGQDSEGGTVSVVDGGGSGVSSFGGRTGAVELQKSDTTGIVDNQLATTYPGSPPANYLLMQHIFQDRFLVNEAIIYADTPPANSYTVTATIGGTTYDITVGTGSSNPNTKTIGQTVTAKTVLRLVCQSTVDTDIADVTVAFDMASVPEPNN